MALSDMPGQGRLYRGLVSTKGVVWHQGTVALLKNRRGEWELPGGKLEVGESFAACLVREVEEELGLRVEPGRILGAGRHHVYPDIVVIIYGCYPEPFARTRLSREHEAVGWFSLQAVARLPLPGSYRHAIRAWAQDPRTTR